MIPPLPFAAAGGSLHAPFDKFLQPVNATGLVLGTAARGAGGGRPARPAAAERLQQLTLLRPAHTLRAGGSGQGEVNGQQQTGDEVSGRVLDRAEFPRRCGVFLAHITDRNYDGDEIYLQHANIDFRTIS